MGMSSSVFQRFILASRLSNGRGLLLEIFDLELLLRTMARKTKEKCAALCSGTLLHAEIEKENLVLRIELHNRTTIETRPRDYHLGFRAAFRAASVPTTFRSAREVCSSLNLRLA